MPEKGIYVGGGVGAVVTDLFAGDASTTALTVVAPTVAAVVATDVDDDVAVGVDVATDVVTVEATLATVGAYCCYCW